MTAALLAGLSRLITGASVRWVNCRPDARQRVYFANHTSHLDFTVIWAALPPAIRAVTRPIAVKEYWEKGKLRRYLAMKVFNAVLIDRTTVSRHNNPIDLMMTAMGERHSLILFPEGTRGTGDEIGPFKSGLYHLGKKKPEVELVPVYIDNLNRVLPKGEFLPVPLLSSISFGPPFQVLENEPKDVFLERAREAVRSLRR